MATWNQPDGLPPSNNPPNVNGVSPSLATPTWSPASLLQPRGFHPPQPVDYNLANNTPQQRLMFQFDTPQGSSQSGTPDSTLLRNNSSQPSGFVQYANENGDLGMGHMLERMHNVASRGMLPQKRRKLYDDRTQDGQKKSEFNGGGKGGVIGEYMREKKEEGQKENIPTTTAVDISTVDDTDNQTISAEDKEVCYGRIEGAEVNAHKVPTPRPGVRAISSSMWPQVKIVLRRRVGEKTTVIYCVDSSREIIGCVDVSTSIGLAPLLDSKFSIRTASRILSRQRQPTDLPYGSDESRRYGLDLNIYGPKKYALQIGRHLSQKQLWLRTPLFVEAGIQVHNPHEIQRPPPPPSRALGSYGSRIQGPQRTTEEIRNDVLGMFDSLERSENLPEMDADPRITTELLKHQKQGLHFMTNKEKAHVYGMDEKKNASLWRLNINADGQKSYYNVITGQEVLQTPPQVLGGLLADMMGLGKTLSVLSLVVQTLDDASEWAKMDPAGVSHHNDQSHTKKGRNSQLPTCEPTSLALNSKATLLVSPLSTIANWEEQIKQHLVPGTLKFYIYHGASRIKDINKLAEYDLVITTYGSVASEFNHRCRKKQGSYPLEQINWFRIVLDEAHMIREQSTQQSKAICRLAAQRRWAVTGTPVQNRLEDLGALMTFLRIRPFDERGGFAQHIMAPFKLCDPEILPKLRLLVDSITLRRLKDRIDLPPRHDKLVKLDFSSEEQKLYDIFAKNAQDRVKVITGQGEHVMGGKSYVHILQSILRLRLICAHGRDLLGEEDLKVMEGLSKDDAIDLDSEDDDEKSSLSAKQAYDMYSLMKQTNADICVACNGKICSNNDNLESDTEPKDEVIATMTLCYHILCNTCIRKWKSDMEEIAAGNPKVDCPVCHQTIKLLYFGLRQGGLEDEMDSRAGSKNSAKHTKEIISYSGPHTKTKALIQDLLASKEESLRNPNEPPIKSVVFSGWTVHLDLIQMALQENGIVYTRLDGRMSRTARGAALDVFRTDPSIHVILVSITAGGLGLNLTTANKVYVMEPQYNPAAEAQAVDRVHRLGQKRPVETTRYIINNSFEEKMLELQDKKKKLASLSMDSEDRKTIDKAEAARKRLEDIRSLFK